MASIEVLLELPAELARGIASGELVRSGGVVRRTSDKAIVAHLREAGVLAESATGGLMLGLGLVQVASLAILERHLNRIEARIDELAALAARILAVTQRVERRQWLQVGEDFGRALQFLKQHAASQNPEDLLAARSRLIQCRGSVRHLICTSTADDLLVMGTNTEWLLRLDLDCAAAEVHVLHRCSQSGHGPAEARVALLEHRATFEEFGKKLAEIAPITQRLPLKEAVESSPDGNPYKTARRWRVELERVLPAIDQEIEFQKLLAEVPQAAMEAAGRSLMRWENPIVVIRPDEALVS